MGANSSRELQAPLLPLAAAATRPPAPIDALPDALLGAILAKVGFPEGRSASAVCKRWRRAFLSEPSVWQRGLRINARSSDAQGLSLVPAWSDSSGRQGTLLCLLRQVAPVLHALTLVDRSVGAAFLPAWLPGVLRPLDPIQLRSLALHRVPLVVPAIQPLLRLQQLEDLSISLASGQALHAEALAAVAQLQALSSFRLAAERLPAQLSTALSRMQRLTRLSLDTWDRGTLPTQLPAALCQLSCLARLELRSDSFQPPPDLLPGPIPSQRCQTQPQHGAAEASAAALETHRLPPAGPGDPAGAALLSSHHQPLAALTCLVLRARCLPNSVWQPLLQLSQLARLELRSTLPLPRQPLAALSALTALTCLQLWQRPQQRIADSQALVLPRIFQFPLLRVLSLYSPLVQLPEGQVQAFDTGSRFRLGEEQRHHLLWERCGAHGGTASRATADGADGAAASGFSQEETHLAVADTQLEPGDLAALLSGVQQAAGEAPLQRLSLRGVSIASAESFQGCGPLLAATTRLSMSSCSAAARGATDADLRDRLGALLALTLHLRHLSVRCPAAQQGRNAGGKLSAGLPAAVLCALPGLRTLRVSGAELAELPPGAYLEGLEALDLENNRLPPHPTLAALASATRLRCLNLAGNHSVLSSPRAAEALASLPALRRLRVGHSQRQGSQPRGPPRALLELLQERAPWLQVLSGPAAADELDPPFFHPQWQ